MIVNDLWSYQIQRDAMVAQPAKMVHSGAPAESTDAEVSLQNLEQLADHVRQVNTPPTGWSSSSQKCEHGVTRSKAGYEKCWNFSVVLRHRYGRAALV
jgi:hypothetical protein